MARVGDERPLQRQGLREWPHGAAREQDAEQARERQTQHGREPHGLEQPGALLVLGRQVQHRLHRLAGALLGGDAVVAVLLTGEVGQGASRSGVAAQLVQRRSDVRRQTWRADELIAAGQDHPGPRRRVADVVRGGDGGAQQCVGGACLATDDDESRQGDEQQQRQGHEPGGLHGDASGCSPDEKLVPERPGGSGHVLPRR